MKQRCSCSQTQTAKYRAGQGSQPAGILRTVPMKDSYAVIFRDVNSVLSLPLSALSSGLLTGKLKPWGRECGWNIFLF